MRFKRSANIVFLFWMHAGLTGQIVPCLSGKGVKGDKQPPPRVWRGVKSLELSPSQKTSIRYQFEVYCKKVVRGERCDYLRQVLRRAEQETCFSDLPFDALLQIGASDDYPSNHYVFEAQGHQISVADDRLGEALSQIEAAGRNLLLLAYFLDLNDREIGTLLGIPRSTIQRRRQRFLDQMKQLLKE